MNKPTGRFSHTSEIGKFWSSKYLLDELLDAAAKVRVEAMKHGISGQAAALRWVLHHGVLSNKHGDGMIIGASSLAQLKENLDICEQGPLPDEIVKDINSVWPSAEPVAPWAWLDIDTISNIDGVNEQISAK